MDVENNITVAGGRSCKRPVPCAAAKGGSIDWGTNTKKDEHAISFLAVGTSRELSAATGHPDLFSSLECGSSISDYFRAN